jgi:type IV pilus assembly protein PilM
MFSKDSLAVDIGSSYTKVLVGDKSKVKLCGLIKTPERSVVDDNLINTEEIKNAINSFLSENKVKPSDISFALHGQDIVIRHVEVPLMDPKGLSKSVEWEISQYLPENGTNYYIDYEIVNKTNTKEKKAYNLMVVAAPKGKINKYAELAYDLGLKLKSIDIAANCAGRVFRQSSKSEDETTGTGIIDIGYRNSNIIILDKGRLYIEREVPFGVKNAVMEISRRLSIDEQEAYAYLFQKFDFDRIRQDNEVEKGIQFLFDNALSSFEKVVQFYTTGRAGKKLDKIYLMGGGCEIPGIVNYVTDYFGSKVLVADSPSKISLKSKFPASFDLKVYVNALGLLLRKE